MLWRVATKLRKVLGSTVPSRSRWPYCLQIWSAGILFTTGLEFWVELIDAARCTASTSC